MHRRWSVAQRRQTVLVVDDERSVRQLVVNVLREAGFHVLDAADGSRAMEIAREHPTDIALLLTDVVLPGINGVELARILKGSDPELQVVFMSGYEEDELEGRGIAGVGAAYVTKPFSADVLTLMVDGALSP